MTTLAAWLIAMVAPLVIRGLIALSFTALTFTGVQVATDALVRTAVSNWGAMPAAVLQLCTMCGIPQVLGMIFGAMTARVAMWVAMSTTRYVFSK